MISELILLCHVQGVDDLDWDMRVLMEQYVRLRGHLGYTGGAFDPVFLQDKMKYLTALTNDNYLPTLEIEMPIASVEREIFIRESDMDNIFAFVKKTEV